MRTISELKREEDQENRAHFKSTLSLIIAEIKAARVLARMHAQANGRQANSVQ